MKKRVGQTLATNDFIKKKIVKNTANGCGLCKAYFGTANYKIYAAVRSAQHHLINNGVDSYGKTRRSRSTTYVSKPERSANHL